jgi:hypothetical protein
MEKVESCSKYCLHPVQDWVTTETVDAGCPFGTYPGSLVARYVTSSRKSTPAASPRGLESSSARFYERYVVRRLDLIFTIYILYSRLAWPGRGKKNRFWKPIPLLLSPTVEFADLSMVRDAPYCQKLPIARCCFRSSPSRWAVFGQPLHLVYPKYNKSVSLSINGLGPAFIYQRMQDDHHTEPTPRVFPKESRWHSAVTHFESQEKTTVTPSIKIHDVHKRTSERNTSVS